METAAIAGTPGEVASMAPDVTVAGVDGQAGRPGALAAHADVRALQGRRLLRQDPAGAVLGGHDHVALGQPRALAADGEGGGQVRAGLRVGDADVGLLGGRRCCCTGPG